MTEWPAAADRRYDDAVIFALDGLVTDIDVECCGRVQRFLPGQTIEGG